MLYSLPSQFLVLGLVCLVWYLCCVYVLISPAAAAGTLGSSERAEGAECGGRVWIHHL